MSVLSRPTLRRVLAVAGLFMLAATLYWVGSGEVLAAMARCNPASIALAATAIAAGTVLGAWNCYRIAELRTTLPFAQFLAVFWRSWAVGITLPGQVADFLTTLWQLKGRSGDINFVAGRLIVDKAITLGIMLALLALVPASIGVTEPVVSVLILVAVGAGAAVALVLFEWCRQNPGFLARRRWGTRILAVLAGAQVPASLAVGNAMVTSAKLVMSGFAYWVVLRSIAPGTPSLATTTVISQTAGLVAYLPISFNGLGTVEISAVAMFGTTGLDSASVVSAYLIMRAVTMAAAWLPAVAIPATGPTHAGP